MSNEVRTVDLKGFLNKHINSLASVAVKTITPERMVRLVCAAHSRQPELAKCTPLSILRSMQQAAEFGLEVCSGANEAYLVPYWNNKAGVTEAQFIPGYQGLVKKAVESGKIRNIEARVVYAKDSFDYELGLAPTIKHKPHLGSDRGDIIAVYAVAFLTDGSTQFEVMAKDEIDAIKNRGKAKKFSPWDSDYSEMARKTVVRRLYKYLPKSKAMADLLEIQAKSEIGDFVDGEVIRPGDADLPQEPIKTLNGDGEVVFHWTDEQREAAKASLDDHWGVMDSEGVPENESNAVTDEFKALIGHPDLSFETWSNRLLGRSNSAIERAKATV